MGKKYGVEARLRWPKVAWVEGNGRYALLAWCDVLTVTLWSTEYEAQKQKRFIDRTGCCGECTNRHEIVDLEYK
jgi:hypothetical protein